MSNNNGKSLAMYGNRDEVREMADRIKRMLPGGAKMSDGDALGLAQIGLAHDLDPFNKEVWLIFNEDTGKSYGVMVGIVGWRKHARKQSEYWGVGGRDGFIRITDPERLAEYGATNKDIVYEYHITDSVSIEAWSKSVRIIRDATGLSFNDVREMIGPMPESVGVGVWQPGQRSKMAPYQAAMYRAERDCLRRRFQVKFGLSAGLPDVAVEPDDEDEAVVAEYVEAAEETANQHEARIMEELGFGEQTTYSNPPVVIQPDIKIDLAHLSGMVDSKGNAYILATVDELTEKSKWVDGAIKKNGISDEHKAELVKKQEAIAEILRWHDAHPGATA